MQITLVLDCLAPGTVSFWFHTFFGNYLADIFDGRHFLIWWTRAMFKFYKMAAIFKYNLTLKSFYTFIIARLDPLLR